MQHTQEGMNGLVSVDLKILDESLAERFGGPTYATNGSAGLDLRACLTEAMTLEPQAVHLIPCGIAIYLRSRHLGGLILPRSGLGHRHGLILGNGTGLIDSDYQGQIFVSLWNRSNEAYRLEPMERIAQLVIIPVHLVHWNLVTQFSEQDARGSGGFGHTGTI